jgi:hypothetical protein
MEGDKVGVTYSEEVCDLTTVQTVPQQVMGQLLIGKRGYNCGGLFQGVKACVPLLSQMTCRTRKGNWCAQKGDARVLFPGGDRNIVRMGYCVFCRSPERTFFAVERQSPFQEFAFQESEGFT